ncbi:MAG: hypothetical protein ACFBSE_23645 [Prochloraceae cyanobacterium]
MANNRLPKYLGLRLERAGLISSAQVRIALQDQIQYNHLEIEDILTLRGWLKPETIEFFSKQIFKLINCSKKITLIKCLEQAGLLTNEEISKIIATQKETGMVLDSLLVNFGYIKKTTIEFFQKYLLINKSETKITNNSAEVTAYQKDPQQANQDSNLAGFKPEKTQKNLKKSEFLDPKKTSILKVSLPRDSFILSLRLNQAGLLSEPQIEIALRDCDRHDDFTIEEIIILRGWLKQETLAFFLEQIPELIDRPQKLSLAECLERSALVSKENIAKLLNYQQETGNTLAALAVELGYIKQSTLDFFVNYIIAPDPENSSVSKSPNNSETIFEPTPELESIEELNFPEDINSNLNPSSNNSETIFEPTPELEKPNLTENISSNNESESENLSKDNNIKTSVHWSEAKTIIGAEPL